MIDPILNLDTRVILPCQIHEHLKSKDDHYIQVVDATFQKYFFRLEDLNKVQRVPPTKIFKTRQSAGDEKNDNGVLQAKPDEQLTHFQQNYREQKRKIDRLNRKENLSVKNEDVTPWFFRIQAGI